MGLCNYSAKQMAEYLEICSANGYVKPSVCQGHYNALVRGAEDELLPLLRKHGIAYYAFSPLGGGFLTGKVTFASSTSDAVLDRTRWAGASTFDYYTNTFDKPEIHAALRRLHTVCQEHHLSLTEVSLRWLMHHSALKEGDAIILGAKTLQQLEGNVAGCRKPPLPNELVKAVEQMWEDTKDVVGNKDSWS
jgi:aflatoxin B1 aldehyde reductase